MTGSYSYILYLPKILQTAFFRLIESAALEKKKKKKTMCFVLGFVLYNFYFWLSIKLLINRIVVNQTFVYMQQVLGVERFNLN